MYNNDQERLNMKTKVLLKKGEGRTINAGGLWIYDNEIKEKLNVVSMPEIFSIL